MESARLVGGPGWVGPARLAWRDLSWQHFWTLSESFQAGRWLSSW